MSWLGKWAGNWLGSWLGPVSSSGGAAVIVSVASVTLSLFPTTASVATGAKATVTYSTIQLAAPSVTIKLGAKVYPSVSNIALSPVAPTVLQAVVVNPNASNLTLFGTAPNVSGRSIVAAAPSTLSLLAPIAYAKVGSKVFASYSELTLYVPDITISFATKHYCLPIDLTLDIALPKVYDQFGSITYIEAYTMKIYAPEILAFSTDITTDMEVVDAMTSDMEHVDGTQQVKLLRKTDNVVIDMKTAQAVPENKIYAFDHALIRQISDRDNRAVKQLRLFMQSVQNDDMPTMDTIIELPMRDDVTILSGDVVVADLIGTSYIVIAVDHCTLKTRWRIGARRLI